MEESTDQIMANGHDSESHLPLSEDEQKILALYDRLQELRLEIAIINAQKSHRVSASSVNPDETARVQDDLLEARARYKLRNDAVETVMIANPVLKAVHAGTGASPVERDLLPQVERRDDAAKSVSKHASDMANLRHQMTKVQGETLKASRNNVELAAELIELAEEVKQKKTGNLEDTQTRQELAQLESEVKASRRRWRIMKGVASGMVVGSGVDWSQDDDLCDIVLERLDEVE